MAAKAILAFGIGVAVVLALGPLGTLDTMNNFMGSLTGQGGDAGEAPGTEAGESSGDSSILSKLGDLLGVQSSEAEKNPADGVASAEKQAAEAAVGAAEEGQEPAASEDQSAGKEDGGDVTAGAPSEGGVTAGGETTGGATDDRRTGDGSGAGGLPGGDGGEGTGGEGAGGEGAGGEGVGTAFVRVMASNFIIEEDYTTMVSVVLGPIAGGVNPNAEAGKVTLDIIFENIGNGHTSFVSFDGVVSVDGLEVKSVRSETGQVKAGENVREQFIYTIKVSDITPDVINKVVQHVVEGNHPVFSFEIKNIAFEK